MRILLETKNTFISLRDVCNVGIENGIVTIIYDDERVQMFNNIDNISILGV